MARFVPTDLIKEPSRTDCLVFCGTKFALGSDNDDSRRLEEIVIQEELHFA